MYACSPKWKTDWISLENAERVLAQLSKAFGKQYPVGFGRVGINFGLHFTGGEPFLNFKLLLGLVGMARKLGIPSTFVETNCFWSVDDETTRSKLTQLKAAGVEGILISVNPFIVEYVPFERTLRAFRISNEVFRGNVMVYQKLFLAQFKRLNVEGTMPFGMYLRDAGAQALQSVELIPMGRACYRLGHLYQKHVANEFFAESCREELTRPWHVHVDNFCNYITGYCAGISLGDARNLDAICEGIELEDRPVIAKLTSPNGIGELYRFGVKEHGYRECKDGYVSKCHLCVDIRKHIAQQTDEFKELKPQEFYGHL